MTLALNVARILWATPADRSFSGQTSLSRDFTRQRDQAALDAERSLVQRIREGDPNAFRTLMEQHFPHATRLANTFVHEQDAAEDIAQDVFTRIWDRREHWEPRVSVRAYILGAVRHAALNVIRHRDVETRYVALEIVGDGIDSPVGDRLDRVAQLVALHAAILDLPERRRVVLTLRFEMELSYPEVGSALGISANAAKELVIRTVESLRVRLRDLL